MAQQNINLGTVANDGTGDPIRTAGQKVQDNFDELYAVAAALGTASTKNTGTAAGNVPVLDGSGLLDTAVLPALAITDVSVVASQAAMLALTAQKGDVAIRSDLNKSFVLSTNSPSTLADWKELLTPTDVVLAVAGLTGTITAAALKTALGLDSLLVGKNYLLNPSGAVAQVPAGSQVDGTYDFDQWLTLTQSNPITASLVSDAENTTPSMMRSLQADASAQRFGRIQWLEKLFCRDLRGQSVTLTARVRMSAATTLRYAIVEWTGTADTITKDVVLDWTNGTFTAGNFFTTTSTTIVGTGSIGLAANTLTDITALTGTVSGSMNNLAVVFWTDSTQAQNVTLDIGKVKLEKGAVATPFVPRFFDQEMEACKRYFEKSYNYSVAVGAVSNPGIVSLLYPSNTVTDLADMPITSFLVAKRVTPTVTIYSRNGVAGVISTQGGSDKAASSGVPAVIGEANFVNRNQSGGSLTLTNNTILFHWTANARL